MLLGQYCWWPNPCAFIVGIRERGLFVYFVKPNTTNSLLSNKHSAFGIGLIDCCYIFAIDSTERLAKAIFGKANLLSSFVEMLRLTACPALLARTAQQSSLLPVVSFPSSRFPLARRGNEFAAAAQCNSATAPFSSMKLVLSSLFTESNRARLPQWYTWMLALDAQKTKSVQRTQWRYVWADLVVELFLHHFVSHFKLINSRTINRRTLLSSLNRFSSRRATFGAKRFQ